MKRNPFTSSRSIEDGGRDMAECDICRKRCSPLPSGRLENGNLDGEPIDPSKVVIRVESIEACCWRYLAEYLTTEWKTDTINLGVLREFFNKKEVE